MSNRRTLVGGLLGLLFGSVALASGNDATVVPLAGKWGFRLDPTKEGITQRWFASALPERINLPGSTDEAGFGTNNLREPNLDHLSRLVEYTGAAWYQREIIISADWHGKRVALFLERCHWETQVWLDEQHIGAQDSLCAPHLYDLGTTVTPGKHRLTILVDNNVKHFLGPFASAISEETQTDWNGIIGRIELRATDPVWIHDMQVLPDTERRVAKIHLVISNATAEAVSGHVTLAVRGQTRVSPQTLPFSTSQAGGTIEVELPMGERVRLWDEFSPSLYTLTASLSAQGRAGSFSDLRRIEFGMRSLGIAGKRFTFNRRPIMLRGTLECCIFPLTGYPPMEEAAWARIFGICRSYGLNHMRFHSWCPPEAAFAAADRAGFLLQVEAPRANVGADPARDSFISAEVGRILAAYGNHPSFAMLCLGNELDDSTVAHNRELVSRCRREDPRHFYTASTAWGHVSEDEYRIINTGRGIQGPQTEHDLRYVVATQAVPVVYHEIGQWAVFPNFAETGKYTGVLRPRNFELVRKKLTEAGMADQAAAFTRASGLFSVLLYKEEIELMLRTPGNAGLQLLDIHDYPGTGTALVGMLDAFWDSKGLTTPEVFRRYCGPTVPLLRMKKRTFTNSETFNAEAEVCHFGEKPLVNVSAWWQIEDDRGHQVASGGFPKQTIVTGGSTALGSISVSLAEVRVPKRLTVTVAIKGTTVANDWQFWVYPDSPPPVARKDVRVSRAWDAPTIDALAAGQKVLLLIPPTAVPKSRKVPGRFTPVFWSPIWFKEQGGNMGLLCDPTHPALAGFPSEPHSNWQWYHLIANSCAIILDGTPSGFRPVVQVIDDFSRNRKLGNLFEARVGKGRLMVCSIDLPALQDRPEGRQLLRSLYAYTGSGAFQPKQTLDLQALNQIFTPLPEPAGLEKAVLRIKAAANR